MRGSLRQRHPGNWELIVQLPRDPSTGRRKQLSRTHLGTKREAQRALAALVADVSAGKISSSATTLHELMHQWLMVVEDQLSPTSVREYRRLVDKKIGPDLGKLRLSKVTTQRLDSYYSELTHAGGLSPASVRHVHAVLRGALGQAVKWGWIPTNPAVSASPPKIRRKEIKPPSVAVARQLLDAADDHDPEFGALLRVLAATGARRGEVCGLRWSDLDTGSRTLSINRSVASVAGGTVVKDTKTHAARRIALDADTIEILERQRTRLQHRAEVCELGFNEDGYVFTTTADGADPLHPDTITGAFSRICKSQEVKGIRLHDLRHLHATQLLAAGVPVRTVSGRLGHANASTTLNVYAHFLEASDREAADVIGNLLGPSE
jgi:integrase